MDKNKEKTFISETIEQFRGVVKKHPKSRKKEYQGVELTGTIQGVNEIEYKTIRKGKGNLKGDPAEWVDKNFALYISQQCLEKNSISWDLNIYFVVLHVKRIRDAVREYLGFCDNIVLQDYIKFFFSKWSHNYNNCFYLIKAMVFNDPLREFAEDYDYKSRLDKYFNPVVESTKKPLKKNLTDENINSSYLLGEEAFVLTCGAISSVNWLMSNYSYKEEEAIQFVAKSINEIKSEQIVKSVLDKTIEMSPYPISFDFKDFSIIGKEIGLNKEQISEISDKVKFS